MIVAFLTDLELMQRSGGKQDIGSVLRKIFDQHHIGTDPVDGNATVLNAIGLDDIKRYVEGTERINWADALRSAGIESTEKGPVTTLSVTPKPSSRQRELLDKLGYNNWRRSGLPSQ
jgi:predicted metalloprotease with PDZ domain